MASATSSLIDRDKGDVVCMELEGESVAVFSGMFVSMCKVCG